MLKEKFIGFFNEGMGVAKACNHHRKLLKLRDDLSEEDMSNNRINPTNRSVQHWFNRWRLKKLSHAESGNGDGSKIDEDLEGEEVDGGNELLSNEDAEQLKGRKAEQSRKENCEQPGDEKSKKSSSEDTNQQENRNAEQSENMDTEQSADTESSSDSMYFRLIIL